MLKEGHISIQVFLLGFGIVSYFLVGCSGNVDPIILWLNRHLYVYCIGFYVLMNLAISLIYRGNDWQVAIRSCFLGAACGSGVIISVLCPTAYKPFGCYIMILSLFHFSEYLITVITNPRSLSLDSFLLNHSVAYWLAAFFSWIEFFLERWLFPPMKECWYISLLGIGICIWGEFIRKLAMITAHTNFNHVVQVKKQENHQLVTWGVYKMFRHPSYVGWFWWSLGTQLILINPICCVAYVITSWTFFNERVRFEEMTLINFFGQKYIDYQKKVGTGLPFINGYRISN